MIRNRLRRAKYDLLGTQWATVLMYHSVAPEATRNWGPWKYAVTLDRFERHVERVAQEYEPVALDRLCDDRPTPEDAVVITFDDGFRDTLTAALPILEEYGAPATVYVTTGFLSNRREPFEYAVAESLRTADDVDVSVNGLHLERTLPTEEAVIRAYDEIKEWGMRVGSDDRFELLSQLPGSDGFVEMLTDEDVAELASHPLITIGAHGYDHLPLTTRSRSVVRADVERCRERLELLTDASVDHFSYPYGSFDGEVISVLGELGFGTGATTRPADVVLDFEGQKRYELPRFDASDGLEGVL